MTDETGTTKTGVTEDMKAAAEKDLKRQAEKRENDSKIRTFKGAAGAEPELYVSDLYSLPEGFDLDAIGPMSYLAKAEGEITGNIATQQFSVIEERLEGLLFDKPARRLEQGRSLRTVKVLKPNGVLGQIPFEDQINNTAAGDGSDAIGVKKFAKKGFLILFDFDEMQPVYCMSRNCFAAAMVPELAERFPEHTGVIGSGYCSYDHMAFTEPNLANSNNGMFSTNATTTRNRGY